MSAQPFFGSVHASGFVFDEALVGRARVVERVLASWTDGARLFRDGTRWYLVGLRGRRVDSREAPGLPVVQFDGRWLTTALDPAALADVPRDALVDLIAGTLRTVTFSATLAVHPSTLLSLPTPRVEQVATLEPPPRPVAPPAPAPARQSLDELFAPLLEQLAAQGRPPAPPPVPEPPPPPTWRERLAQWWANRRGPEQNALPVEPGVDGADQSPTPPGMWARLRAWLGGGAPPALPPPVEEQDPPAAPPPRDAGLWSRLRAWLGGAQQPTALPPPAADEQRPLAPVEDDAPPRGPGLWSRLRAWLGGAPRPPAADEQPPPPGPLARRPVEDDARPRSPGLWSRLRAWLGGDGTRRTQRTSRLALPPVVPPAPPVTPGGRGFLSSFSRWFRGNGARGSGGIVPPVPPVAAGEGGFFASLGRWFRGGDTASASRPPAQRPDRYFDELRRAFEENLGEALRRAVPLANGGVGPVRTTTGITPFRRDSLSLLTPPTRGGAAVIVPDGEFEAMRKFYRETADALIARGQIDEAAFVLAKLLHDATAAVALLEKHGRFELAAQVATAQHLSDTERIRLWLLAGRTDEALRLVRGSHDFEALITALTPRSDEVATRLRVIWGDYLAQRQRWAEALLATAPLGEAPEQWASWRDQALEVGGAAAVTALATDLRRNPEHLDDARVRLREVIEQDRALLPLAAQSLLKHAPAATGPIHRDLWRELMRDASDGRPVDRYLVQEVLKSTNDRVLVADAVPNAPPRPARERQPLEVPAPIASQLRVFDVAPLPKGRRVLALGAAGLKVVSPSGQTLKHHLVKADALVVGPLGSRVLVLSLDGALTRVWRLDPLHFGIDSWFQAGIDAFSRRFDGLCWAVGMERSLVLLDPATPAAMEWWRVPQFNARDLDAQGRFVSALGTELAQNESRRIVFEVGAQTLERRLDPSDFAWWRSGDLVTWSFKVRDDARLTLTLKILPRSGATTVRERVLDASGWQQLPMDAGLVLARVVNGSTEVSVVDWSPSLIASLASEAPMRLVARLAGTRQVTLRELAHDRLGIADEHGRVTEVEL